MRNKLLKGSLPCPVKDKLVKFKHLEEDVLAMWKALWNNFLNEQDSNSLFWYDKLGFECFNSLILVLSKDGWIENEAVPIRKWASMRIPEKKVLEFVSVDELAEIRASYKYKKYTLTCTEASKTDVVKQNGEYRKTGLVREGLSAAGSSQFGYDMDALQKYEEAVKLNLTKSMDKVRLKHPEMRADSASYDNVSVGIFDHHVENKNHVFSTGESLIDSRGRAISQCLKKVANPIGNKDFRSALVIAY